MGGGEILADLPEFQYGEEAVGFKGS